MKPELFFDSLSEDFVVQHTDPESIGESLSTYFGDRVPDYKEADIVIFSVNEFRGNSKNEASTESALKVRAQLYNLMCNSQVMHVVDLGSLRPGPTLHETNLRIKEVCNELLTHNTIPVIIGGSHDLDYGQFLAYEGLQDSIKFGNVDAFIDMSNADELKANSHIQDIILHEPNILMSYYHIAHQSYLVKKSTLENLEKLNFETYRLGVLRDSFEEIEPVIRSVDALSFDVTSIRKSDFPANTKAQSFGLIGEEACRLCWYAGMSHTLSSIGFYEYNDKLDVDGNSAKVLATMIWYFIEGFYNRKGDLIFGSSQYTKYVVDMSQDPGELIFYKHKSTEKWWMEVQYFDKSSKKILSEITPCSYADFQLANGGEIPNRWLMANARLA